MLAVKIVLIGSTGHSKYVVNGLKDNYEDKIVGIAPGSEGESVDSLYQKLANDYDLEIFYITIYVLLFILFLYKLK